MKTRAIHKLRELRGRVACDTETTGLSAWAGDRPFIFTFCDEDGRLAYLRGQVDPLTRAVAWLPEQLRVLQWHFNRKDVEHVFFNAKFDIQMSESVGLTIARRDAIHDVIFAAHACNSLELSFKLKYLAARYLRFPADDEKALKSSTQSARAKGKKLGWKLAEDLQADYWMADRALCKEYALNDAERTIMLHLLYDERMDELKVRHTYEEERQLLVRVTMPMEARGVRVRERTLAKEIRVHEAKLKKFAKVLTDIAPAVNPRSPKQLGQLLYGELGLTCSSWTDSGQPSVDGASLEALDHPYPKALVKYRAMEKALESFFYKYRDLAVRQPDGLLILHPGFNQVGPVTGRYSCRNPNLQNVANALTTRSSEPIQARTPLGPRPGMFWLHADYSQLEVRIFADVAQEEFMLDAIAKGRDLHTECANKAWGGKDNPAAIRAAIHALELDGSGTEHSLLVLEAWKRVKHHPKLILPSTTAKRWLELFNWDIVKAEKSLEKTTTRAKAKMLLFLKVFGGGAAAAADLMGVLEDEARTFLEDYDRAFPRIGRYIRQLSNEAARHGYIINQYDRRLAVDPDKPYRAVNYMVQGSAASLLKNRMLACEEWCEKQRARGIGIWQILTIHDEIVFEVEEKYALHKPTLRQVKQIMEDHGGRFSVPLPVEFALTRQSWAVKDKEIHVD